jgi:MFS family permease
MFLLGVGSVSHITLSQTLLMDNVEDEFRGRVASVLSMSTIVVAFGLVPIGVAVDMLGGRTVALAIGTMLLAISFVVFISQKQLRRLD